MLTITLSLEREGKGKGGIKGRETRAPRGPPAAAAAATSLYAAAAALFEKGPNNNSGGHLSALPACLPASLPLPSWPKPDARAKAGRSSSSASVAQLRRQQQQQPENQGPLRSHQRWGQPITTQLQPTDLPSCRPILLLLLPNAPGCLPSCKLRRPQAPPAAATAAAQLLEHDEENSPAPASAPDSTQALRLLSLAPSCEPRGGRRTPRVRLQPMAREATSFCSSPVLPPPPFLSHVIRSRAE